MISLQNFCWYLLCMVLGILVFLWGFREGFHYAKSEEERYKARFSTPQFKRRMLSRLQRFLNGIVGEGFD